MSTIAYSENPGSIIGVYTLLSFPRNFALIRDRAIQRSTSINSSIYSTISGVLSHSWTLFGFCTTISPSALTPSSTISHHLIAIAPAREVVSNIVPSWNLFTILLVLALTLLVYFLCKRVSLSRSRSPAPTKPKQMKRKRKANRPLPRRIKVEIHVTVEHKAQATSEPEPAVTVGLNPPAPATISRANRDVEMHDGMYPPLSSSSLSKGEKREYHTPYASEPSVVSTHVVFGHSLLRDRAPVTPPARDRPAAQQVVQPLGLEFGFIAPSQRFRQAQVPAPPGLEPRALFPSGFTFPQAYSPESYAYGSYRVPPPLFSQEHPVPPLVGFAQGGHRYHALGPTPPAPDRRYMGPGLPTPDSILIHHRRIQAEQTSSAPNFINGQHRVQNVDLGPPPVPMLRPRQIALPLPPFFPPPQITLPQTPSPRPHQIDQNLQALERLLRGPFNVDDIPDIPDDEAVHPEDSVVVRQQQQPLQHLAPPQPRHLSPPQREIEEYFWNFHFHTGPQCCAGIRMENDKLHLTIELNHTVLLPSDEIATLGRQIYFATETLGAGSFGSVYAFTFDANLSIGIWDGGRHAPPREIAVKGTFSKTGTGTMVDDLVLNVMADEVYYMRILKGCGWTVPLIHSFGQVATRNGPVRFFAMPRYPATLAELIPFLKTHMIQGTFITVATRLLMELIVAVDSMHKRHIIHRDLKPDNIFITDNGHLVLGDLGLAHELLASENYTTSGMAGTYPFCAPEVQDEDLYGCKADWYSVGVIAYQLFVGDINKFPFANSPEVIQETGIRGLGPMGDELRDFPGVCKIVDKLISANPDQRPNFLGLRGEGIFCFIDWSTITPRTENRTITGILKSELFVQHRQVRNAQPV